MANAKRRRRKNGNRAGRMCITCIVFVFAIVMSTQIIKVYQKDQEYIAKQADLEQQCIVTNNRSLPLQSRLRHVARFFGKYEKYRTAGIVPSPPEPRFREKLPL